MGKVEAIKLCHTARIFPQEWGNSVSSPRPASLGADGAFGVTAEERPMGIQSMAEHPALWGWADWPVAF